MKKGSFVRAAFSCFKQVGGGRRARLYFMAMFTVVAPRAVNLQSSNVGALKRGWPTWDKANTTR